MLPPSKNRLGLLFGLLLLTFPGTYTLTGCAQCRSDTQCGENFICLNGRCVTSHTQRKPPPNPECTLFGETRPCYKGPTGTAGKGRCKAGQQTCDGTQWSDCKGETLPLKEECNGTDDDCDGNIDQGLRRACYGGPSATQKKGECKDGVQDCKEGKWELCQGDVIPEPESCNGKDDDCNGKIDDAVPQTGLPCTTALLGPCRNGQTTCLKGALVCTPNQQPTKEECNQIDDDCNGSTDEGCPCPTNDARRACGITMGLCIQGLQTCTNLQWSSCKNNISPQDERCNGKDDNCNGKIDETCECQLKTQRPCGSEEGECKPGQQQCDAGKWGTCIGSTPPKTEVCNGKDDDCNGKIDDGLQCN